MTCRATIQARPASKKHLIVQNKLLQRKHTGVGQHMLGRQSAIPFIQPKLTVGQPNDKYEQEADRVAEQVMRMPAPESVGTQVQRTPLPKIQRACSACEKEKKLQAKEIPGSTPEVTPAVASRIQSLQGGGQPLPTSTRNFFEPRFGQDFSRVRVHVDAQSTQALNAKAYTIGKNIIFNTKQYAPDTTSGRYLLAHELTHTVQQSDNSSINKQSSIQRQLGGNQRNLTNPRFAGNKQLESALDNQIIISVGFCGDAVRLIQEALLDLGFELPKFGADCDFGSETQKAVAEFQSLHGAFPDGQVGTHTMELLDKEAPLGPPPIAKCPPCQPTYKKQFECNTHQDCVDKGLGNFCTDQKKCEQRFGPDEIKGKDKCQGRAECDPTLPDIFNIAACGGSRTKIPECMPIPGLDPSCGVCGGKQQQKDCNDKAKNKLEEKVQACKDEELDTLLTECPIEFAECSVYFVRANPRFIECLSLEGCPMGGPSREKDACEQEAYAEYFRELDECRQKATER
ncbi:MAG: DUF4157 domain-containing protein [Cyanobacteria bacterium P01_D01_bin.56]